MFYQRIYGDGRRTEHLDGYSPDDEATRLAREQMHPRFPWRDALLKEAGVARIALPPALSQQCHSTSKEPEEQMYIYFGLQWGDTFYALVPFPLSASATSRKVTERGVSDGRSRVSALEMQLLQESVPDARCIVVHSHPFTEAQKLKRLGYSPEEIGTLQAEANVRFDFGMYPWLQSLPAALRDNAALNELVASALSKEDIDFTGPGYQLLIWEDPASEIARLGSFRIDSDLRVCSLDDVQTNAEIPAAVALACARWEVISQAVNFAFHSLHTTNIFADDWLLSPRSSDDGVHERLYETFGEDLRAIARGRISLAEFCVKLTKPAVD